MATFYRGKNFSGVSVSYSSRQNNLSTNNNQYSSIKITNQNSYIVVYDNVNLTGNSMVICEDINDLALYGFDKKIRSMAFYPMPTYANIYYQSYDACSSFNAVAADGSVYSCSGFFLTPNGYLATAAHCVMSDVFNANTQRYDPLTEFHVAVSNVNRVVGVNRVFQARLVGYDPIADIAVLKVDGLTNQQTLSWGKSRQTPIGSRLFVLGNPAGVDEDSFASGIVRDNKYNGEFPLYYIESILTDATIIGGNSGGPLINAVGQVIGLSNYGIGATNQLGGGVAQYVAEPIINRMIAYDLAGRPVRSGYDASNASYVVPSSSSHPFLFNDGSSNYGALGCIITQMPKWLISYIDINGDLYRGALVYDVDPASNLASYVSADDIIVSVDQQELGLFKSQITPHSVLFQKLPGQSVTIQYYKYSEAYMVLHTQSVVLTKYPNNSNFDTVFMSSKKEMEEKYKKSAFVEKMKAIQQLRPVSSSIISNSTIANVSSVFGGIKSIQDHVNH